MSRLLGFIVILAQGLMPQYVYAGTYSTPASHSTDRLIQQHNTVDGSWSTPELKYVQTSEAVLGLAATNRRTPEYYADLTYLPSVQNVIVPSNTGRALRWIVRDSLNADAIVQFKSLANTDRHIEDLAGFQYATNLTYLDVRASV